MPPRYAYWTILIDDKATAFRAREREELLPTFTQLKRTNQNVVMRWFARGRLWESRDAEHDDFQRRKRSAVAPPDRRGTSPGGAEKRGRDWRPGGTHKDPRDRFKKKNRPERAWSEKDPATQRDRDKLGPRTESRPWRDKPAGPPRGDRPWQNNKAGGTQVFTPAGPRERKPWSKKPPSGGPRGDRPWSNKPPSGNPRGDRPWSSRPPTGKPRDDRPWSAKPPGGAPRGHRPWKNKPRDQHRKPFARGPKPEGTPADNGPSKRRDDEPPDRD